LWLIEVTLQGEEHPRRVRGGLLAIGLTTWCAMLAGHPQVPLYAIGGAMAYAVYRARSLKGVRILGVMLAGIAAAGFVFWPMMRLFPRSPRLRALDPPSNDIALPYARLGAFLFPWKDGWPEPVGRQPATPFADLPAYYFWDTVCYVGWFPFVAVVVLVGWAVVRRKAPPSPWPFLGAMGLVALLLALPPTQQIASLLPGTILRSPARLLYLSTFTLALAAGLLLDALAALGIPRAWRQAGTAVIVLAHVADLSW